MIVAFITLILVDLILYMITPYKYTKKYNHKFKFLPISGFIVFCEWIFKFKII